MQPMHRPMALLAELTYRCPLQCPYCSNPIELTRYRDELDASVWARALAEAAELGVIHVHFSGGEPLVRRDLAELVSEARRLDLYTNLSTGATLADEARLEQLRKAGLDSIQISLLDAEPDNNDRLAGAASFSRKRAAVLAAKRLGFPVTLNVVLHRQNLDHLAEVIDLAFEWDVDRVELAHAQYTGWAFRNRAVLMPTRGQVERAAELAESARARARQRTPAPMQILHVMPDYFQDFPKACLNGWGRATLTVAPDGAVLPCQSAREIPGLEFPNVKERSLHEIWFDSPVFNRFRGTDWMPEPCRSCDRREIDFGGCRCQAFLVTGNLTATDPVCKYSPDRGLIDRMLESSEAGGALEYRRMA